MSEGYAGFWIKMGCCQWPEMGSKVGKKWVVGCKSERKLVKTCVQNSLFWLHSFGIFLYFWRPIFGTLRHLTRGGNFVYFFVFLGFRGSSARYQAGGIISLGRLTFCSG